MAITKIMNIKECSGGSKGIHLFNSIHYILNPEKTSSGLLVGGNAGVLPGEIYHSFIQTKERYNKYEGRQGYHFVISFKPDECDEETAYAILSKFCERYLGDNFDYVFSIHNDKNHMHGHIIFNSVNRKNGYKYRYKKGDWEKYIQPITDRLCEDYGISILEYDKSKKQNSSYVKWAADTGGKMSWKTIIRQDISHAILSSNSMEEFEKEMISYGYSIRKGESQNHGTYYAFTAPGQKRAWRSYNLGDEYTFKSIEQRVIYKLGIEHDLAAIDIPKMKFTKPKYSYSNFQKTKIRKCIYVVYRRWECSGRGSQREVRKTLLNIDKLREGINYLIENDLRNIEEVNFAYNDVTDKIKRLKEELKDINYLNNDVNVRNYKELLLQLNSSDLSDKDYENLDDEIERTYDNLPPGYDDFSERKNQIQKKLNQLYREKHILQSIISDNNKEPIIMDSNKTLREKIIKNKYSEYKKVVVK